MRPLPSLLIASALVATASCSFLLDFDGLKGEATDASVTGGNGTGASGGAEASTGGASGGGGAAGVGGGGGAAGSDASAGIPLSDLGAALAAALCQNLDTCYQSLVEIATQGNDCTTYFGNIFSDSFIALLTTSIDAGALSYDPVKGAQCVNALNPAQGCVDPAKAAEECKIALTGLKPNGSSCTHTFECVKGSFCDTSAGCPSAVCKSYGQTGGACDTTEQCAEGLTCFRSDVDAGSGTCQPYTAKGDPCDKKPDCAPGTFCVNSLCLEVKGLFQANAGSPCYHNGVLCTAGNSCEFTGIPVISSANCVPDTGHTTCGVGLPDSCGADSYCETYLAQGSCKSLPAAGLACANSLEQWTGLAPKCKAGSTCVNKTCRAIARLDEPCYGSEQCASLYCLNGDPDAGTATGICKPPACVQ